MLIMEFIYKRAEMINFIQSHDDGTVVVNRIPSEMHFGIYLEASYASLAPHTARLTSTWSTSCKLAKLHAWTESEVTEAGRERSETSDPAPSLHSILVAIIESVFIREETCLQFLYLWFEE